MMHLRHYILPVLTLLASAGCTVMENRKPCPSYLTVNLSLLPEKMVHQNSGLWLEVVSDDNGIVVQETVSPADYPAPDWYIATVPKGYTMVSALVGRKHWRADPTGRTVSLADGYEADSLYAHAARADCTGESARDTVLLHKQWCTVSVILKNAEKWKDYSFRIISDWSGIDLSDLTPVAGRFICSPRRTGDDSFEVRIPRQGDNGVELNMYDSDGELLYSYPLGAIMYGAGYDWFRKDLDDVKVTIDVAQSIQQVEIRPWDSGEDFGNIEM